MPREPEDERATETVVGSWRAELAADEVGSFEWDVRSDAWRWSDEMYALHGYDAGEVEPSRELVLRHKARNDRPTAERIFAHASRPDFRFRHLHHIVDAHGRERLVLTVGSAVPEPGREDRAHVVRGHMTDLTTMQREVLERLMRRPHPQLPEPGPDESPLSNREREVLELIAAGHTNEQIAAELFVSINTVKTYIRTAYRKIGASRRSQAIVWLLNRQQR